MTSTTSFNSAGSTYNSLKFNALPGDSNQYNLRFRLFFPNRYLKLDNLPVGTPVGVLAQFHISGVTSWYYPNAQIAITYYDSFLMLSILQLSGGIFNVIILKLITILVVLSQPILY